MIPMALEVLERSKTIRAARPGNAVSAVQLSFPYTE